MLKIEKSCFFSTMFFIFSCSSLPAIAQLNISAQLRTRTEFRDGYGTLRAKNHSPSFFTSQRSRLIFNYKTRRVIVQTSIQDVRVWGQDASTIGNDGTRLGVHEAWAEILLSNKRDSSFHHSGFDYLAVKIGRQELMYDDSRLLGNLDWLQQGRHHDAVVCKFLNNGWQLDLGAAFNQNTDAFNYNGTYYTPANVLPYVKDSRGNLAVTPSNFIPYSNTAGISSKTGTPSLQLIPSTNGLYQDYKALQFLYAAKTFGKTKISGLILSDQFGKYINDSVKNIASNDTGYIYGKRFNQKGVNARVTAGLLLHSFLDRKKNVGLIAGYYYQAGKDRDGLTLAAFTSTIALAVNKDRFTYTAGWDYISGNSAFPAAGSNHRFDPLYGTPHKFWGFMDYFYVGTGAPAAGLADYYANIKYTATIKEFTTQLGYHYFRLAQDQKNVSGPPINKSLGSEFDLLTDFNLDKTVTLECGFSLMAATKSMEYAKNVAPGTTNLTGTWSYLMIIVRTGFILK
jgi:hypothetical protein